MESTDNLPTPRKKTGNKPKQLVTGTYEGIEVGKNKKVIDPIEVEKLASEILKDVLDSL